MEMTSSFKIRGQVLDYELEPVFKMYGLKNGDFDFQGKLSNMRFRTAIQLRQGSIDFVRKWDDCLMLRLTKNQFSKLVKWWPMIQKQGTETSFRFNPLFTREVGGFKVSVTSVLVKGAYWPKMYVGDEPVMGKSLNISGVEIMANSAGDLGKILSAYIEMEKAGWQSLQPMVIELGNGNPKKPSQSEVVSQFGNNPQLQYVQRPLHPVQHPQQLPPPPSRMMAPPLGDLLDDEGEENELTGPSPAEEEADALGAVIHTPKQPKAVTSTPPAPKKGKGKPAAAKKGVVYEDDVEETMAAPKKSTARRRIKVPSVADMEAAEQEGEEVTEPPKKKAVRIAKKARPVVLSDGEPDEDEEEQE